MLGIGLWKVRQSCDSEPFEVTEVESRRMTTSVSALGKPYFVLSWRCLQHEDAHHEKYGIGSPVPVQSSRRSRGNQPQLILLESKRRNAIPHVRRFLLVSPASQS